MKKKPVDYSGFSLRRLNEPRFSHMKLLLGWVFYFSMYFITENLIPAERCHPIHCALDDLIPFNEFFVIFYVGWYLLVFGTLAYTLFFDVENFKRVQTYIIITQVIAMACYVLYPSRQDLRPEVFERNNILTALMAFIYSFDTSTGVCPSLHVGYSLGIASVWCHRRNTSLAWKCFMVFSAVAISLSTAFVKQHSVVDIFAALPVGLLAEYLVFGPTRLKRWIEGGAEAV